MEQHPENATQPSADGAPTAEVWLRYRAGAKDMHGNTIREIIRIGDRCAVYVTDLDRLGFNFDPQLCVDTSTTVNEAYQLLTELKVITNSKRIRSQAVRLVGGGMAQAFYERVANDKHDYFTEARDFVRLRRKESLHIRYVAAALITAFLASVICAWAASVPTKFQEFMAAGGFGAVGAFVSVAQRFQKIPVDRFSSGLYTVVAGVSRALLGALFGALFLLLHKAGVVLDVAAQQPHLLLAASFISGFSERLMPELLERFERTVASKDPKPGKAG